jgi:hypothetical protein
MLDAFQFVQVAGAAAILAGFAMLQLHRQTSDSYAYILLNLAGGVLLLISAVAEAQWGFIVLEAAWTVLSAWSLAARLRPRPTVA